MTLTKKRVAFYGRISDADDSVGVERQEKSGRRRCAQHEDDWDLVAVLIDNDRSAKDEDISKRPDFVKLLSLIEQDEVDIVLSFHPDRISRNGMVIERFLKLASAHPILFITSEDEDTYNLKTASGQKNFRSAGVNAIYESAHRAERTRLWIEEQAEEGKIHGGFRPYGIHRASKSRGKDENGKLIPWEDEDGNVIPQLCPSCGDEMKVTIRKGSVRAVLEVCPVEQARLCWFANQTVAGATLYSMAKHANDNGWPTVRGGEWRLETIRTILDNSLSKGLVRGGGPSEIGALLPETLQESLRKERENPRRRVRAIQPTILGGLDILKCGICGGNLQACQKSRNNLRYGCIRRPGVDQCGRVSIMRERCEETVDRLLVDALTVWREEAPSDNGSDSLQAEKDLVQVIADLEELNFERYDRLPADERMDDDVFRPRMKAAKLKKKALEDKISAALAHSEDGIPHSGIDGWWAALKREEKRKILKTVVERIEVAPSPAGRIFDPSRVSLMLASWIIDTVSDTPAAQKLRAFSGRRMVIFNGR